MRATRTRRELCVYHGLAVYESTNTNIIQITRYNFPMSNKRIRVMAIGICPIVLSNYFIVLNTLEHLKLRGLPPQYILVLNDSEPCASILYVVKRICSI